MGWFACPPDLLTGCRRWRVAAAAFAALLALGAGLPALAQTTAVPPAGDHSKSTAAPAVVATIFEVFPASPVYSRTQINGISGSFLGPVTGGASGFMPAITWPHTSTWASVGRCSTV